METGGLKICFQDGLDQGACWLEKRRGVKSVARVGRVALSHAIRR